MILDNALLSKIRTYASLGYSPVRICLLVGIEPNEMDMLITLIETPGSDANQYYNQGIALGDYNKDVELTKAAEHGDIDAITLLGERQYDREVADLKKELFDV